MELSASTKKTIAELINSAVIHIHREIETFKNMDDMDDVVSMMENDARDYENLLELFINGKYEEFKSRYWQLDTASRDHIFDMGITQNHSDMFMKFIEE